MKYLFYLSKLYWIGILGFIGTFFSDLIIFKLLSFFVLFLFLSIVLNYQIFKCSFLQIKGIFEIKSKYKDNIPSVDNYKSKISYCLPFKGKWAAINGCISKEYSHSWDIPTQRYAYDFIILDETGKSFDGNPKEVTSYYCYGKEILSPADGIVVEINNNSLDSIILNKDKFISRAKHVAGNYIVIQHTENEYSTFAHLKKDSMKIKVGDKVYKGQAIAQCGNTGNSTEPHLHFQLQTGQNFYNSAGLPIYLDNLSVSEVNNYEKYDSRQHMNFDKIPAGYVTRGYNYENKQ